MYKLKYRFIDNTNQFETLNYIIENCLVSKFRLRVIRRKLFIEKRVTITGSIEQVLAVVDLLTNSGVNTQELRVKLEELGRDEKFIVSSSLIIMKG